MTTLLLRGRLLTPRRDVADGWVLVEGGRIMAIGRGPRAPDVEVIGDAEHVVTPGLVDLQVNGFAGHDAAEGLESFRERRPAKFKGQYRDSCLDALDICRPPQLQKCKTNTYPRIRIRLDGTEYAVWQS